MKNTKNIINKNNQNNINTNTNTNTNTISSTKERQKSNSKRDSSKRNIQIKKINKKCSLHILGNNNNSNSISIEGTLNKNKKKNIIKKKTEIKSEFTENLTSNRLIKNKDKFYKYISNTNNKKSIDKISSRECSSSYRFQLIGFNVFSKKYKVKNKIEKKKK